MTMNAILEIPAGVEIGYGRRNIVTVATSLKFSDRGLTLLVGRNGVGKTTFLKYLCGCLGNRPSRDLRTIYLPEEIDFAKDMTPLQIANSCLRDSSVMRLKCEALAKKPWGSLSKGNKQKVRVTLALAMGSEARAQLICLDEPFSGMDYAERRILWADIAEKYAHEHHVLMSIHPEPLRSRPDTMIGVSAGKVFAFPHPEMDWETIEKVLEPLNTSEPQSACSFR